MLGPDARPRRRRARRGRPRRGASRTAPGAASRDRPRRRPPRSSGALGSPSLAEDLPAAGPPDLLGHPEARGRERVEPVERHDPRGVVALVPALLDDLLDVREPLAQDLDEPDRLVLGVGHGARRWRSRGRCPPGSTARASRRSRPGRSAARSRPTSCDGRPRRAGRPARGPAAARRAASASSRPGRGPSPGRGVGQLVNAVGGRPSSAASRRVTTGRPATPGG